MPAFSSSFYMCTDAKLGTTYFLSFLPRKFFLLPIPEEPLTDFIIKLSSENISCNFKKISHAIFVSMAL